MVMYFAKLKNEFNLSEYEKIKDVVNYGVDYVEEFKGIDYCKVKIPNMYDVYKIIPQQHRKMFGLNLMRINSKVPAHTDSIIKTCINFYIKTEPCITYFHEPIVEQPRMHQINNQSDGHMFNEDDLKRVADFIAKPNEAWILDVKKPHSVVPLFGISERRAFTLATNHFTFDEVCDMLKETGNL
jgi:hypothetical protein